MKPKKCPFYEKCDYPDGIECEKNYTKCKFYAWQVHKDTIPLPLVCPFILECSHQTKNRHCTIEAEGDYRDCRHFSEWFWEKKAES